MSVLWGWPDTEWPAPVMDQQPFTFFLLDNAQPPEGYENGEYGEMVKQINAHEERDLQRAMKGGASDD